jgi:ribosomal protein S27AE
MYRHLNNLRVCENSVWRLYAPKDRTDGAVENQKREEPELTDGSFIAKVGERSGCG